MQAVDLVVVEQVSRFSPDLDSPWNTAYERLVRRLLGLPGAPAVVALQAFAYRRSGKQFQNVRPALFFRVLLLPQSRCPGSLMECWPAS